MIIISIIYLIGGSFIDDLAFMILATPIFYPAIIKLGFDPIWFGMIIAITVMVGVVIPPVAINVFVVNKITKVPFGVIYGGVYPFLISSRRLRGPAFYLPATGALAPQSAHEVRGSDFECLGNPGILLAQLRFFNFTGRVPGYFPEEYFPRSLVFWKRRTELQQLHPR